MLIALSTLALCLRTCGELPRLRGATHPAFRAQIALDRPDPNLRSALTRLSPYPFPSFSQRPCRVARPSTGTYR